MAFFFACSGAPGGAERRFSYLYESLREESDCFYLITNRELVDFYGKTLLKDPEDCNIFSPEVYGKGIFGKCLFVIKVLFFLKKQKVKWVHFCINPGPYSFVFSVLSFVLGFKVSVSVVNSTRREKRDFTKKEFLFWRLTFLSSRFIDVLSPSIKFNLLNIFGKHILPSKITISPCTFSRRVAELKNNYHCVQDSREGRDVDCLFMCRLVDGKGVDLFLKALDIIESQKIRIFAHVAGDGYLYDEFASRVYEYVQLVLHGYVDGKEAEFLLRRTKFALSLQSYENYPSQFVLEAIASGCEVIATDVGDTRLLLNESNSYLVPACHGELAESLLYGLKEYKKGNFLPFDRMALLEDHSVFRFKKYFLDLLA
ncbi:glycosyltransferase [Billgrantia antri]|uniref:glycosyltransferase n=1 Tax=Billgrantia antri TaxID=2846777 RepID=UPI001CA554A5